MPTPTSGIYINVSDFPAVVELRDFHGASNGLEYRRMVIILEGRALYVSSEALRPIRAGDVFIVEDSQNHEYRKAHNLRLLYILFRPEILQPSLNLRTLAGFRTLFGSGPQRAQRRLRLTSDELDITLSFVEILIRQLLARKPRSEFIVLRFAELVGYLSGVCKQPHGAAGRTISAVEKAINHLEVHFSQPTSLDHLAGLVHMSKRSFSRSFQTATGCSPFSYLTNVRLARAAEMLRSGAESVTSVAYKVGYNDSNYFARRFRSVFGVSPIDYRKQ